MPIHRVESIPRTCDLYLSEWLRPKLICKAACFISYARPKCFQDDSTTTTTIILLVVVVAVVVVAVVEPLERKTCSFGLSWRHDRRRRRRGRCRHRARYLLKNTKAIIKRKTKRPRTQTAQPSRSRRAEEQRDGGRGRWSLEKKMRESARKESYPLVGLN